jgi:seryl-tRNA synthetase
MTEALQKLEEKIKQLLVLVDRLETENNSLRSMAQVGQEQLSQAEVIGQIESLRLEKDKLEKKLGLVERSLDGIISELDNLEF